MIEVIIASAISLVVILGIAEALVQLNRENAGIKLDLSFIQFGIWPMLFPVYPSACTAAIGGQPFTIGGTNAIAYKDPSGVVVNVGSVFNLMTFTKIQITDLGTTGVPNQYNAQLDFQARKPPSAGGSPFMNRQTNARILYNAGTVQLCF